MPTPTPTPMHMHVHMHMHMPTQAQRPRSWASARAATRTSLRGLVLLLVLVLVLGTQPQPTRASHGDANTVYQECVRRCVASMDAAQRDVAVDSLSQACDTSSLWLRIFQWDCAADCRYRCMRAVEAVRHEHDTAAPVWQYHGKWPFVRVWGMQEIGSVVFSVLNGLPHALHLLLPSWRARFAPPGEMLRPVLLFAACVGVNTWWWSAVFHARDTVVTERLDYHCATLLMVSYCWIAIVRLLLDPGLALRPRVAFRVGAAAGACLLGWLGRHVYYLNVVKFDYGYNMRATAVIFALQALVWLTWAYRTQHAPHAMRMVRFQAALTTAAILEAVDFPPLLGLIDAHAVWHALTVYLGFYWYKFLVLDARWRVRREAGKEENGA